MMNLVIRADAAPHMGTGHVMRCLALAQACQDRGGRPIFAMAGGDPAIAARLAREGMALVSLASPPGSAADAAEVTQLALAAPTAWVVVDGYHFDAAYQRRLKDAGLRLLVIDDYAHAGQYHADIVVNQNLGAAAALYPRRRPGSRLLLGPAYVLLRREFLKWRDWPREIPPKAGKVLVTLGGSDPDNATLKVLKALLQVKVEGLTAMVVVGGANPHRQELQSWVRKAAPLIRLETDVEDMPRRLAWAEAAVAAPGSTAWELAFMGVPSLLLVLAENQRAKAEHLQALGVAHYLGWQQEVDSEAMAGALTQLLLSAETRAQMSRRGRELVDGQGAWRVMRQLQGESD
jgi:UDP-2,4-diacetamido-2,4,6-trideoxy-beta-L-altropyranose hydrolase